MLFWIFHILGVIAAFFAVARLWFVITQLNLFAMEGVIVFACYSAVFFRATWPSVVTYICLVAILGGIFNCVDLFLGVGKYSLNLTDKGKKHFFRVVASGLCIRGLSFAVAWYFCGF